MPTKIILLGSGGHARVILDAFRELGGEPFDGVECLGNDAYLLSRGPSGLELINGISDIETRARVYNRFKAAGFVFQTVVHPSAVVARNVHLGEGSQIMAGALIQSEAEIGCNVIVNTGASVDHNCRIGDHSHIAPGAALSGRVEIGSTSLVGVGSAITPNVSVGAEWSVSSVPAPLLSEICRRTRLLSAYRQSLAQGMP